MLAALISAATALTVFTLTQWWTYLKSHHDFLKGKLEEMLLGFHNVRASCTPLKDSDSIKEQGQDGYLKFYAAMLKPTLLIELYFPDLKLLMKDVEREGVNVLRYYRHAQENGEKMPKERALPAMQAFSDALSKLQELAMADREQLTKNPIYKLKRFLH